MKVLWLTFIPSPYRLTFFEELSKQCELKVLFERASSSSRRNNWDEYSFCGYTGVILNGITIGGYDRLCFSIYKYLNDKSYDIIVISNPTSPTGILAAAILQGKKRNYIIESDGAFPSKPKGIKKWIKRFVMKPAIYCLSTAKVHDQYYLEYGVLPKKILRYPFTSIKQQDILPVGPDNNEKATLREELGITESKCIITVGRFSYEGGYGKGYDILLRIAEKINNNIGVYIIGDDPTREFADWKFKAGDKLSNLHFINFLKKDDLALYYRAADVFVLLSRGDVWGLVINEAMANSLPVVVSDCCVAAQELIIDALNGYVVKLNDEMQIFDRINDLLSDDVLRIRIGEEARKTISKYTIEVMSECHIDIFTNVTKN